MLHYRMASLFEKLALNVASKRIAKPDLTTHSLSSLYQKYLPLLKKSYNDAFYWHGTGRFHYKVTGKSKYDGVDHTQTYDVLQSIIDAQCLAPKYDPFVAFNKKFGETISLSPYRIYARGYAEFNLPEEMPLQYTYGSTRFWHHFLAPINIMYGNPFLILMSVLIMEIYRPYKKYAARWTHTFRKTKNEWSILDFYKLRSDIPHNYGVLIGIRKEGVHPIHFNKVVERFETRTDQPIEWKYFTHIEVPLSKVEETERLLKINNVILPVIPIEIGELYCSNTYSLAQLSGIKE